MVIDEHVTPRAEVEMSQFGIVRKKLHHACRTKRPVVWRYGKNILGVVEGQVEGKGKMLVQDH